MRKMMRTDGLAPVMHISLYYYYYCSMTQKYKKGLRRESVTVFVSFNSLEVMTMTMMSWMEYRSMSKAKKKLKMTRWDKSDRNIFFWWRSEGMVNVNLTLYPSTQKFTGQETYPDILNKLHCIFPVSSAHAYMYFLLEGISNKIHFLETTFQLENLFNFSNNTVLLFLDIFDTGWTRCTHCLLMF